MGATSGEQTFPFEAGNGGLKGAMKAANTIPHHICGVPQMEGVTEELVQLAVQPKVAQFCASLDTRSTQQTLQVEGGISFFSVPGSCDEPLFDCVQHARMLKENVVLTSSRYAKGKTTNSPVVQLCDPSYAVIENTVCSNNATAHHITVKRVQRMPVKYTAVRMEHLLKVE